MCSVGWEGAGAGRGVDHFGCVGFRDFVAWCRRLSSPARFVEMALGSAMELRAQLRFAAWRGWMGPTEEAEAAQRRVERLVQSIIRFQKGLK